MQGKDEFCTLAWVPVFNQLLLGRWVCHKSQTQDDRVQVGFNSYHFSKIVQHSKTPPAPPLVKG
ncbi:hypothetical protein, partial [Microcoleus sp. herbarium13]|uniref:hypothetical protein n=1 Tax=Microcoleus sp. herbarium13 TaxID=3055438 RepID=UPI002FD05F64